MASLSICLIKNTNWDVFADGGLNYIFNRTHLTWNYSVVSQSSHCLAQLHCEQTNFDLIVSYFFCCNQHQIVGIQQVTYHVREKLRITKILFSLSDNSRIDLDISDFNQMIKIMFKYILRVLRERF